MVEGKLNLIRFRVLLQPYLKFTILTLARNDKTKLISYPIVIAGE